MQAAHEHRQHLRAQTHARAGFARGDAHGFLHLGPDLLAAGLPVAPLQVAHDPLEVVHELVAVALVLVDELHLAVQAVQEHLAHLGGQLLPGGGQAEAQGLGQLLQELALPPVLAGALPAAGLDAALAEAQVRVGHDQLLGELALEAQPIAGGAGAERGVEGEGAGLQIRQPQAEALAFHVVAGQLGGEQPLLAVQVHQGRAFGQVAGDLQAVREPGGDAGSDLEPVDDHFDGVLLLLVQVGEAVGEVQHLAVDPGADVAALHEVGQELAVLALARPHHRRQELDPGALLERQDLVRHLLDGLAGDGQAAGHAHRLAHPGIEQAQVVVDLGHRGHGGAGVLAGGLLLDGNGRGQAVDAVHVRLLHLVQELPGIGAEALHVAALPLGIERVESQAGLAAAGKAGDHHQLVPGQDQVDVLEVVFPGPLDVDAIHADLDFESYAIFSSWAGWD